MFLDCTGCFFFQLYCTLEEIRSSLTLKINNISDAIQENSLKITNACVQVSNLNNRLSLFAADQFIESVSLFSDICINLFPLQI